MSFEEFNSDKPALGKVSLMDSYKVKHWCRRFNVSEQELRDLIRKVGDRVTDIEKYLKPPR